MPRPSSSSMAAGGLRKAGRGSTRSIRRRATCWRGARKAQPKWAALSGHTRARHLYAIARLVQRHSRLFAVLESLDNGKPIRETRDIDIPLVARHFYHHAGWAQLRNETFIGYEPIG